MRFTTSLTFGLGLLAGTHASPAENRHDGIARFTLHGGPASYELSVPTDGTVIQTNNGISIDTIDTTFYEAVSLCTFNTPKPKTLTETFIPAGVVQITVGPPQPILSVSCRAE